MMNFLDGSDKANIKMDGSGKVNIKMFIVKAGWLKHRCSL